MYTYTSILAIMALLSLIILIGYICITTKLIYEQHIKAKDMKDVSDHLFVLFTFLIILATIILFINY